MVVDVAERTMVIARRGAKDETVDEAMPSVSEPSDSRNRTAVVVAIESSDCTSFFRSRSDKRRLKNRASLVYDLEEFLPIDADDLAIDLIETPQGSLIIATEASAIRADIDQLESCGHYVSAVSPVIFLAIAELVRTHPIHTFQCLAWQSSEGVDLVRLERGNPIEWRWCDSTCESAKHALESMFLDQEDVDMLLVDASEDVVSFMGKLAAIAPIEMNLVNAAEGESARIASGASRPFVDLRSGPLESSDPYRPIAISLKAMIGLALFLQLCLVGSASFVRWRYQQKTRDLVAAQEDDFSSLFPNAPLPVGVLARIESEHRQLAGTRGMGGNNVPELKSTLPVAHAFLSAVPDPEQSSFAIDRIELLGDSIQSLTGNAKSYADLESLAESLRTVGFTVPPVSATKTNDGVSLRLNDVPLLQSVGKIE